MSLSDEPLRFRNYTEHLELFGMPMYVQKYLQWMIRCDGLSITRSGCNTTIAFILTCRKLPLFLFCSIFHFHYCTPIFRAHIRKPDTNETRTHCITATIILKAPCSVWPALHLTTLSVDRIIFTCSYYYIPNLY